MVWWFERGGERLTCEVRRSATTYDIVVERSDGIRVVTPVATPHELLERMESIPRSLIYGGWRPRWREQPSLRSGTGGPSVHRAQVLVSKRGPTWAAEDEDLH